MAKAAKKAVKKGESRGFSKYIKWFWIVFAVGVLSVLLVFQLAAWGFLGEMPTFERL